MTEQHDDASSVASRGEEDSQRTLRRQLSGRRVRAVKKNHKCSECGFCFSKSEHIVRHMRLHTKEKPFPCVVCGKSFARRDTLLRHSRSHSTYPESSSPSEPPETPVSNTSGGLVDGNSSHNDGDPSVDISNLADTSGLAALHAAVSFLGPLNVNFTENAQVGTGQATAHSHMGGFPNATTVDRFSPVPFNAGVGVSGWDDLQSNLFLSTSSDKSSNAFEAIATDEFGSFNFNSLTPLWQVTDDFDLAGLNSTIEQSISQYAFHQNADPTSELNRAPHTGSHQNNLPSRSSDQVAESSNRWFTSLEGDPGGHAISRPESPGPESHQVDVDEAYRMRLSQNLRIKPRQEALPSTEFLNLCIRMYFTRFHPIFPLLHAPTFQPSSTNALLLLSICSIGSLFIGSLDSIAQGIKIFERLNKAILASWEHHISRGGDAALSMIQAAIIGQTFGLLSGNPWHLTMVDVFQGTVIAWARRNKMFHQKCAIPTALTGPEIEVHNAWCRWARKEETIRVVLALNVHDFEMASIFHHDPILRHDSKRFPSACIKALFDIPTANQWATFYQAQNDTLNGQIQAPVALFPPISSPTPANFTSYAYLSSLGSQICELRHLENLNQEAKDKFTTTLLTWHQTFSVSNSSSTSQSDPLCLLILWHSLFITIHSNLDLLEQALGRDSSTSTQAPISELVTWASSSDARRCVIHALLAYRLVESIPSGAEPAIHVPRVLYLCGVVLFCYTRYCVPITSSAALGEVYQSVVALPETKVLEVASVMWNFVIRREAVRREGKARISAVEEGALCAVTDLLGRIGHWGIARSFKGVIEGFGAAEKDQGRDS